LLRLRDSTGNVASAARSCTGNEKNEEIGNDIQQNAVEIRGHFRDGFAFPLWPVCEGGGKQLNH
jgi:hypothetical protein